MSAVFSFTLIYKSSHLADPPGSLRTQTGNLPFTGLVLELVPGLKERRSRVHVRARIWLAVEFYLLQRAALNVNVSLKEAE